MPHRTCDKSKPFATRASILSRNSGTTGQEPPKEPGPPLLNLRGFLRFDSLKLDRRHTAS